MNNKKTFLIILALMLFAGGRLYAQQEEQINYFQMEPLDDSLFIHIQQEVFYFSINGNQHLNTP